MSDRPKLTVAVHLGIDYHRFVAIFTYAGRPIVDQPFMEAVDNHLKAKHGEGRFKEFDYIEIIGYEPQPKE